MNSIGPDQSAPLVLSRFIVFAYVITIVFSTFEDMYAADVKRLASRQKSINKIKTQQELPLFTMLKEKNSSNSGQRCFWKYVELFLKFLIFLIFVLIQF